MEPRGGIIKDENGLIIPRKIVNPCLESSSDREMRWNKNKGINVLGTKSELEKVLAKQRKVSEDKIKKEDKHIEDEFQRILTERAKRLEQVAEEAPTGASRVKVSNANARSHLIETEGKNVQEQETEYARVFAQLRGEKAELVC